MVDLEELHERRGFVLTIRDDVVLNETVLIVVVVVVVVGIAVAVVVAAATAAVSDTDILLLGCVSVHAMLRRTCRQK